MTTSCLPVDLHPDKAEWFKGLEIPGNLTFISDNAVGWRTRSSRRFRIR